MTVPSRNPLSQAVAIKDEPREASALAAGWAALRRFYRPFIIIQCAALALVVGYYSSERVRALCTALAHLKTAGGLPVAALSASFAGGLLPELAKIIGDRRQRFTWRGRRSAMLFNLVFFAFNGVVIDVLYRGEARLFGVDAGVATVAKKVAFDQFVFTPLWLPVIIALYLWHDHGFSFRATASVLRRPGFYKMRVVPLLLPDWLFWIPMVSVIYVLPTALQFLLFVLALGAWSLIMVSIADPAAAAGHLSVGTAKKAPPAAC